MFFKYTIMLNEHFGLLQTIIEALNYITTGDMPPNSKGAAFVFDPKVISIMQCLGLKENMLYLA